jgi:hypothetical protein
MRKKEDGDGCAERYEWRDQNLSLSQGDTKRPNERCQVGVASLPLHIEEREKKSQTKVQRRQQRTVPFKVLTVGNSLKGVMGLLVRN